MSSVKDVIKSSIYESLGGGTGLSAVNIIQIMIIACLIGIYIFYVYKLSSKSAFYSKDLNITLAGLVIVVAAIIIAMQSSLIVSLGMVGALSIVRFRNAVKNPIDLLYLFWAISAGIICGVGLWMLAVLLCVIMTALLLILESLPNSKAPSLLIISFDAGFDIEAILQTVKKECKVFKEKSRSAGKGGTEVIVEVKTTKKDELLKSLLKEQSIREVNFLSYDGESRI